MLADWRQSLTTDKLAPAILVRQWHILLLKYRRGELHLWGTRGQILNGGRPRPILELPLLMASGLSVKICRRNILQKKKRKSS